MSSSNPQDNGDAPPLIDLPQYDAAGKSASNDTGVRVTPAENSANTGIRGPKIPGTPRKVESALRAAGHLLPAMPRDIVKRFKGNQPHPTDATIRDARGRLMRYWTDGSLRHDHTS